MKIWKAHWAFIVIGPLGALGLGYAAHGAVTNPPVASADLAAWVQAVGSIVAIVAVFLVSRLQHANDVKRDEAKDRLKIARMIQGLRDELQAISGALRAQIRVPFMPLGATDYIDGRFYFGVSRYPIYHAHAGHLGSIPSAKARSQTIAAYSALETVELAMRAHNDDHERFQRAIEDINGMNLLEVEKAHKRELVRGGMHKASAQLVSVYKDGEAATARAIASLDECKSQD